jgi:hypothetical protein
MPSDAVVASRPGRSGDVGARTAREMCPARFPSSVPTTTRCTARCCCMRSLRLLLALMVLVACSGSEPGSAAAPSSAPNASAPHASATPSPAPATAPPVTAAAATTTPAPAGFIGLGGCPPYASGQHPLGSIGAPGAGAHADPLLDWQGCGSVVVPAGTSRFMTGNNWQLGYALSGDLTRGRREPAGQTTGHLSHD